MIRATCNSRQAHAQHVWTPAGSRLRQPTYALRECDGLTEKEALLLAVDDLAARLRDEMDHLRVAIKRLPDV